MWNLFELFEKKTLIHHNEWYFDAKRVSQTYTIDEIGRTAKITKKEKSFAANRRNQLVADFTLFVFNLIRLIYLFIHLLVCLIFFSTKFVIKTFLNWLKFGTKTRKFDWFQFFISIVDLCGVCLKRAHRTHKKNRYKYPSASVRVERLKMFDCSITNWCMCDVILLSEQLLDCDWLWFRWNIAPSCIQCGAWFPNG